MPLRFVSLFSGIEAASAAWGPLGWTCAAVAEIDPFGCAALAHHYPTVPNLGDVTKITREQIAALGPFDLIVFGSPCQDLSIAGKRKGFNGDRSRLFHDAMQIVQWARVHCGARFALWENVPGAFSSNDGADFAAVVAALAGIERVDVPAAGWGNEGAALGDAGMVEWSTLDAQWFGVAQRRRRVFALADFGNWAGRPPILLESTSLRGHSEPQRETREDFAGVPDIGVDLSHAANGVAVIETPTVGTICAEAKGGGFTGQDAYQGKLIAFASNAEGSTGLPYLTVSNLSKQFNNQQPLLAFAFNAQSVMWRVRRFTPVECERLQGYPDNFTRIPYTGGYATDTPRFRALGNTMCVHVMRWIGRSIEFAAHYF